MKRDRKTLKTPVSFQGKGLHTGTPVKMTVHPSSGGISFRLNGEKVAAHPSNVTDTTRSTRLGSIGTVEHMMSAFCGLEITDAEVELDAPEVPGMDGSSAAYVEAFQTVGFESLEANEIHDPFRRVFFQDESASIAIGKGHGGWRYSYDTGDRWPGRQDWGADDVVSEYLKEISACRTFAFSEEVPHLIQLGLGQGLDESSVLILGIEGYKNSARFLDEPVRHKMLDLMGDLYLAGVPARWLSVVAERSGHRANVKAASMLAESLL